MLPGRSGGWPGETEFVAADLGARVAAAGHLGHREFGQLAGQAGGARRREHPQLRLERPELAAEHPLDRVPFLGAERHRRAEEPPHLDRLGVVIAVHVRDEEPAHVRQAGAEAGQRPLQLLERVGQGPAGVDQHQAAGHLDRVDVHRAQRVRRQGQRDPVHARRD